MGSTASIPFGHGQDQLSKNIIAAQAEELYGRIDTCIENVRFYHLFLLVLSFF